MRRPRLLLAACSAAALSAATLVCAACTSILGIEELPLEDASSGDAATVTTGPDGSGDGGFVMTVDAGHVQTIQGVPGDLYGTAVAVSPDGRWIAVGAPASGGFITGTQETAGAVFLYLRDSMGTYDPTAKQLSAMDFGAPGGEFGDALAFSLDGNFLAVGAPHASYEGNVDVGAAFVYELAGGLAWQPYAPLPPQLPASAQFGTAIAFGNPIDPSLYGAQFYVGAPGVSNGGPQAALYSFALSSGDAGAATFWARVYSPGDTGDFFGLRLAATSESTVVVGAPGTASDSILGAAYLVDMAGTIAADAGVMPPVPTSIAVHPGPGCDVGAAVALTLDGTKLAIGAIGQAIGGNDAPLGEVLPFAGSGEGGAGVYVGSSPLTGSASANYGAALAITSSSLLIGDPGATVDGATGVGMVYRLDSTLDAASAPLQPPPELAFASSFFGMALASTADGGVVVVGAPSTPGGTGAVYVYTR